MYNLYYIAYFFVGFVLFLFYIPTIFLALNIPKCSIEYN